MEDGRKIDTRGLFEAARLMQTAADLGGDIRRAMECKSVATFWASTGISEAAQTPDRLASEVGASSQQP